MGLNICWVGLGSLCGGVSRYLLSLWIKQMWPGSFPAATFIVNFVGCLLIGILSGWLPDSSGNQKLLWIVGFCGSFTTFSTFSLDNFVLLNHRAYGVFILNVCASVVGGLLATGGGYWLGKILK